jgi:hypothetical protein
MEQQLDREEYDDAQQIEPVSDPGGRERAPERSGSLAKPSATIVDVTVVPMLAPNSSGMACGSVSAIGNERRFGRVGARCVR